MTVMAFAATVVGTPRPCRHPRVTYPRTTGAGLFALNSGGAAPGRLSLEARSGLCSGQSCGLENGFSASGPVDRRTYRLSLRADGLHLVGVIGGRHTEVNVTGVAGLPEPFDLTGPSPE
ncbi:hypothetical protein [Streptomyces phaeoluteigriseus]|uniref:hypothetical protein n=1 Tax=Streptomyces phaeoluteigriseus TaxID=114686 RepID=UPI0036BAF608